MKVSRASTVGGALVLGMLFATAPATAADHQPLMSIEARLGGGLSLGAGNGNTVVRGGPYTAGLLLEFAILAEPWTTAYVGAFVDGYRGAGLQLAAGLRLRLNELLRISGGLVSTVVPYTLFGASIAPGVCHRVRKVNLCGDAQVDVMFLGDELPEHRVAIQLQLVLGAGFDVL